MRLRKTPQDATGTLIKAETVYVPVQPYSSGYHTYNAESRLRGDSKAVQTHPAFWAPEGLDRDELHRLRMIATTPAYVDHSRPRPTPIPLARQAIAAETFTDGKSGRYVRAGHVLRDDDPVVKANKRLFHRPAQPLEAA